jgi:hypothetical protein
MSPANINSSTRTIAGENAGRKGSSLWMFFLGRRSYLIESEDRSFEKAQTTGHPATSNSKARARRTEITEAEIGAVESSPALCHQL